MMKCILFKNKEIHCIPIKKFNDTPNQSSNNKQNNKQHQPPPSKNKTIQKAIEIITDNKVDKIS